MTSDVGDLIPVAAPWTRRLARELAIPKRRGELTSQGFCWMVTSTELMLIEMRRLVRRLEARRSYRERRARARSEPELRDLASLIRRASKLTAELREHGRWQRGWQRRLQRLR